MLPEGAKYATCGGTYAGPMASPTSSKAGAPMRGMLKGDCVGCNLIYTDTDKNDGPSQFSCKHWTKDKKWERDQNGLYEMDKEISSDGKACEETGDSKTSGFQIQKDGTLCATRDIDDAFTRHLKRRRRNLREQGRRFLALDDLKVCVETVVSDQGSEQHGEIETSTGTEACITIMDANYPPTMDNATFALAENSPPNVGAESWTCGNAHESCAARMNGHDVDDVTCDPGAGGTYITSLEQTWEQNAAGATQENDFNKPAVISAKYADCEYMTLSETDCKDDVKGEACNWVNGKALPRVADKLRYAIVPNSPKNSPSWAAEVFTIDANTGEIFLRENRRVTDSRGGYLVQKDDATRTVNYEHVSVFTLDIAIEDDGGCLGRKRRDASVSCPVEEGLRAPKWYLNEVGSQVTGTCDDCCATPTRLCCLGTAQYHVSKCDPPLSKTEVITIKIVDVNEPPRVNEGSIAAHIDNRRDCERYNPHGESGIWTRTGNDPNVGEGQGESGVCQVPYVFAVEENREIQSATVGLGNFAGKDKTFTPSGSVEGTLLSHFDEATQNCERQDAAEDAPDGTAMVCAPRRVIARDDDEGQECGKNDPTEVCDEHHHLHYEIVPTDDPLDGSLLFGIEKLTGQVFVSELGAGYLDYEKQNKYVVKVRATDSGNLTSGASGARLSHERFIIVRVIDINEHPVFSILNPDSVGNNKRHTNDEWTFTLREQDRNSPREGLFVGQVLATDPDAVYVKGVDAMEPGFQKFQGAGHRQLTFSFEPISEPIQTEDKATGNYNDAFEIDEAGNIYIKNDVLDYEDINHYEIMVRVTDDRGFNEYALAPLYAVAKISILVGNADDTVIRGFTAKSVPGAVQLEEAVYPNAGEVYMGTRGLDRVVIKGVSFGSKWRPTTDYEVTARYETNMDMEMIK